MLDLSAVFARFPILETERLILRDVTLEDTPDILHIMRDPLVTQYLERPPMATMEEAEQRVRSYRATFEHQEGLAWAIFSRQHGKVVGTCVYWNLNRPLYRAEIGYVMGVDWWGQGIMHEALTAILNYGFNTMGLHSVEAQTFLENVRSQHVLEKLGFEWENDNDEMRVFLLTKSAWEKRH